jgi:hypothetical protein
LDGALLVAASLIAAIRLRGEEVKPSPKVDLGSARFNPVGPDDFDAAAARLIQKPRYPLNNFCHVTMPHASKKQLSATLISRINPCVRL